MWWIPHSRSGCAALGGSRNLFALLLFSSFKQRFHKHNRGGRWLQLSRQASKWIVGSVYSLLLKAVLSLLNSCTQSWQVQTKAVQKALCREWNWPFPLSKDLLFQNKNMHFKSNIALLPQIVLMNLKQGWMSNNQKMQFGIRNHFPLQQGLVPEIPVTDLPTHNCPKPYRLTQI